MPRILDQVTVREIHIGADGQLRVDYTLASKSSSEIRAMLSKNLTELLTTTEKQRLAQIIARVETLVGLELA